MPFTVAIIGRPNVGKSTLFNRLTGKRHALVDDQPGVTRDRREGDGRIGPLHFKLVDTAGLDKVKGDALEARMTQHSLRAIEDAHVVMLMVDARAGITEEDKYFAKLVRKQGKPVILVINKAEAGSGDAGSEAYRMGFGEPVAISAEHGEGMADLYNALAPHVPEEQEEEPKYDEENPVLQIAIIGRPNVGKSTLFNTLLNEERVLTGPEAGITRDAIAVDFNYKGRPLKLVDTAGIRRRANVTGKLEKLSVTDSLRAIQYAHVVILMVDAEAALEKQDSTIASLIEREGRAMVLAVNKWDKIKDKQAALTAIHYKLEGALQQIKGVPVVPISGINGRNIDKLFDAAFAAYDTWNKRVNTGALNRWLEEMLERHPPPVVDGRRIKLRYMTQNKARPPSFVIFSTKADRLTDSYQRYLVNGLRETFELPGVPIRIQLRKNKNPYVEE